jgi:CheY-like chemotaxis protein
MGRASESDPVEILLVEDNPGDVRLTREGLRETSMRNRLHVVSDGEEAMAFLYQQGGHAGAVRPDLILLDLNLPGKDGRQVLAEVKSDPTLNRIPVVVLSTSADDADVAHAYDHHANCYVTKPVDLHGFIQAVRAVENYWVETVRLPSR